ncbi:hypothetical protein ES319_A08G265100v1 [Gossypium barbadense]|uniref:HSF-type DNA-binding domain-containing protein n=3 Tax=Gossypium TaxID=3633 RepID=A0A5J5UX48_GOSBA|nr:hypothetical protein ES319_A08G265100v1 [Gossypium barbadense]KAB2072050.1 hypothetical protein ES319_A08G265100v1 [Gossypium barbadense]TYI16939.1 hypothetical protein ES332_A08G289800v1 [Gossypium tomentosum]TYI16940.1 hypothetical protein ES332_A08G289800v1 [Gossypium tomentosum]
MKMEESAAMKESTRAAIRDGDDDQKASLEAKEMSVVDDMINGGDLSSSSTDILVEPMAGINGSGPPPFLTKTFEIVEDPETDPIVSWSIHRNSFIVWDSHKFSENLLPKYFKHKNLSSFIRQLNTYGFKKIDSDRWEFANEGFQGGKKHLLKNIKRKNRYNSSNINTELEAEIGILKKNQSELKMEIVKLKQKNDESNDKLEAEIGILKKNQSELKMEIVKLKQKNDESNDKLTVFDDRIRFVERRQQQMLNFLVKLVKFPILFQQLMKKKQVEKKELDEGEFSRKKRRLLETQVTKSLLELMGTDQTVTKSLNEPMETDRRGTKNLPEPIGTDQRVTKNLPGPMGNDQSVTKSLPEPMGTDRSVAKSLPEPIGTDQRVTKDLAEPTGTDQCVPKTLPKPMETNQRITKTLPKPMEIGQSVINSKNQVDQVLEPMQSDHFSKFLLDCMEKDYWVSMEDQENIDAQEMSSVYHVMAENLLGESSCVENATNEELSVKDSKVYLELEDLINWKPSNLTGFVNDLLVEQTG